MDSSDPYATGKANLRDNVKTLAAVLAGIAGLVLAGTPFSGFGALEPWSSRFNLAVGGLVVGAVFLFLAWRQLIFSLGSAINYPNLLRETFSDADVRALDVNRREKDEIFYLRKEFKAHSAELLPNGIASVDKLDEYLEKEWQRLEALDPAADKSNWERYLANLDAISYWGTFVRLQFRVRNGINVGQWFGVAGLVGLMIFAWAANPKKADSTPSSIIRIDGCSACSAPVPAQPASTSSTRVEFETDKAVLDRVAYDSLRGVTTQLRAHPEMGVLLLSHTDTVASDARNRLLATQRADAVYKALVTLGGVASSRVFVSPQPKSDLPVLTNREIAQRENRSVEFLLVALPIPRR